MKNIRVYDYFLNNSDNFFRIRYLLISLCRTLVFNTSSDTIYYRINKKRKMRLNGIERKILIPTEFISNLSLKKMPNIRNISNVISEYLSNSYFSSQDICNFNLDNAKEVKIIGDSHIKNNLVSMYFDSDKNKVKYKSILCK